MTIFTKNDNIYPKNDGFLTLIVVKMTIYTDVRDRRQERAHQSNNPELSMSIIMPYLGPDVKNPFKMVKFEVLKKKLKLEHINFNRHQNKTKNIE